MTEHSAPTPRAAGFRMPAEWEPRAATWLVWPTDPETFPADIIDAVERTYVAMICALRAGEAVHLLVDDEPTEMRVRKLAGEHPQFFIHRIATQDVWIRDYGPTFITNGREVAMNIWRYNAYGEKWPELMVDARVPHDLHAILKLRAFTSGIFLEGGSIEVNGRGTCLTTESCLLNKNRNRECGREDIESCLRDFLNVARVIWLPGGLVSGDDTDGHIDNIARFVNATTVVCAYEENQHDENYEALRRNFEILKREARDQDGRPLSIVPLPMPGPVRNKKSGRLPASYTNFYIGNRVVLLPTYGHAHDDRAHAILRTYFPDRQVVPIDATPLVWGFGSIHCVTQQQPCA